MYENEFDSSINNYIVEETPDNYKKTIKVGYGYWSSRS